MLYSWLNVTEIFWGDFCRFTRRTRDSGFARCVHKPAAARHVTLHCSSSLCNLSGVQPPESAKSKRAGAVTCDTGTEARTRARCCTRCYKQARALELIKILAIIKCKMCSVSVFGREAEEQRKDYFVQRCPCCCCGCIITGGGGWAGSERVCR